ncbi:hypothetical protein CASFOL_038930 [Castilleja foliolosa]|uniref:Aminotransferase-like plant mobile domain-containing protein n=1 Tax=Castilleja foliolosa TaxID=1961234 RepID=A0ABD3BIB3_9LAMI
MTSKQPMKNRRTNEVEKGPEKKNASTLNNETQIVVSQTPLLNDQLNHTSNIQSGIYDGSGKGKKRKFDGTRQLKPTLNGNNTAQRKKTTTEKGKKKKLGDAPPRPKLKTRNSGYALVNAFREMNAEQLQAIDLMGYGDLKEMKVTEIPSSISYWLLENFDPKSCVIKLQNNKELHVEEEDVTYVLGLPRGNRIIKRQCKKLVHPIVHEWKDFFPKHLQSIITAKMVSDKMIQLDASNVWFKRMFLILMTTCLVECLGNGYVSTQIIANFEDVDNARTLNWGQYMKRCLVDQTIHWQKNKHTYYTGPILFLLDLYVDRVELFQRFVPRAYPSIQGWTCALLRKREECEINAEGFGHGYPEGRYEGAKSQCQEQTLKGEKRKSTVETSNIAAAINTEMEGSKFSGNNGEGFAENFLKKAKLVADTMSELFTIVQNVQVTIMDNIHFRKVFDTTEQLLGCKFPMPPAEEIPDAPDYTSTQADDEFWGHPDTIALIDEIIKGVSRRNEFRFDQDDGPNWSLGLTQDFGPFNEESNIRKETENSMSLETPGDKTKEKKTRDIAPERIPKIKVHPPQKMATRNKDSTKQTEQLLSPYRIRAVNPSHHLEKEHKELCFWVMDSDELDREQFVFDDGRIKLLRPEICTMTTGAWISNAVIDAWSAILNKNEQFRSKASPVRFFATTAPCLYTIVNAHKDWSPEQIEMKFHTDLLQEFEEACCFALNAVEIFIMPIYQAQHYAFLAGIWSIGPLKSSPDVLVSPRSDGA